MLTEAVVDIYIMHRRKFLCFFDIVIGEVVVPYGTEGILECMSIILWPSFR